MPVPIVLPASEAMWRILGAIAQLLINPARRFLDDFTAKHGFTHSSTKFNIRNTATQGCPVKQAQIKMQNSIIWNPPMICKLYPIYARAYKSSR